MKPLSLIDLLFILLENKRQPMHIAGLCLFELPKGIPNHTFFATLFDDLTRKIAPTFPFDSKIYRHLFWQKDTTFDIGRHFFWVELGDNASMDDLLGYISKQHSRRLDKNYPLWEFHLIKSIAPKQAGFPSQFAVYLKTHHALVDGIAAMRLFQRSLSPSPQDRLSLPIWAMPNQTHHQKTTNPPKQSFTKTPWHSTAQVLTALKNRFGDRHKPAFTSNFVAPKSLFNQKITEQRHITICPFDKSRFARIAKHFNATTNDVILAVCSGALRRYLIHQNALPKRPLIGFAPISLRQDDSSTGNQISFLLTNLATHQACPKARLATITASTNDAKSRLNALNQTQIIAYSVAIYGLFGINLATGLLPKKQAFNLIISNIPGTKTPLFLNGAKLTGIYPASVLFDGQALNITVGNYQNSIDFCITACQSLPNIDWLIDCIKYSLTDYENLIAKHNSKA